MKVDLKKIVVNYDNKPLLDLREGVESFLPDGTQIFLKFGVKVKDSDGKEVELIDNRKPTSIGDLLIQLVITPLQTDNDHTFEQRKRLFELAQIFHKGKNKQVELKAEDIVQLKERALKLYIDPIIYYNVINALDPN